MDRLIAIRAFEEVLCDVTVFVYLQRLVASTARGAVTLLIWFRRRKSFSFGHLRLWIHRAGRSVARAIIAKAGIDVHLLIAVLAFHSNVLSFALFPRH